MEVLQSELLSASLSEEQQREVARLQHGIAVLDLFDQEDTAEDRRNDFLARTSLGAESREAILQGPYEGNVASLEEARRKAKNRYKVNAIKCKARYHHALYLGMEVRLEKGMAIVDDKVDSDRLSREHGNWRAAFASKQRKQDRKDYRRHLQEQISDITGEELPELPILDSINIEDRAVLMTRALNSMAHRSMLSGLNVAIVDDRYKTGIYDRYKEGTGKVKRGSLSKVNRLYLDAQQDFWDANNLSEFIKSGVFSEALLRQLVQHWWDTFARKYDLAPNHERLSKTREVLSHYVPERRLAETLVA